MAIAFSVLSLKRNRSTSNNSKAHSFTNVEPVSKLSKLKSGFSIFSKITQSLTQQDHAYEPHSNNNRKLGLFQYFRNNSDHDHVKYSKKAYDNDRHYEYNHYYNTKKNEDNHSHHERNIHTLPTTTTKKLTGILIKRSGTNPTTIAFKNYQPASSYSSSVSHNFSASGGGRNRTYSNATISNMTINSEDLTAKEFADIAGIRILPEEDTIEDDIDVIEGGRRFREEEMYSNFDNQQQRKFSQDEDIIMNNATVSSRYTTSIDHHERLSVLSYTSFQSHSTNSKLKIWDNEFWSHPEISSTTASRNLTPTSKTRTNTGASEFIHDSSNSSLNRKLSTKSTTTTNKLVEPPILHELRRMNTTGNDSFIKKGRFEIHLGSTLDGDKIDPPSSITSNTFTNDENTNNNYTDSTLSFSDAAGVLEWKRKGKKTTLSS